MRNGTAGKSSRQTSNAQPIPESLRGFAEQFGLTAREREVFVHLVEGRAQKEIAAELGVAESTVRFHAVRFYSKCGVRNQREALALFVRVLQRAT